MHDMMDYYMLDLFFACHSSDIMCNQGNVLFHNLTYVPSISLSLHLFGRYALYLSG